MTRSAAREIDPITRDVFQHELIGVAEEMSMALRRSAYSSIIWDMYDYACGLLLPNGDMIAQAETIAAQLGIMPTAIHHMFARIPLAQWNEGDVIVCNDPYQGCTHTPDIVLFTPVFHQGRVVAIASTIAHHIDVGGKVPGSEAADAVEVFEEGLVLPPLKLVERGEPNAAIFDIFTRNVRDPDASLGDLRAQIAGCRTGERRVRELCERYGVKEFASLARSCCDYTETYIRNALLEIGEHDCHAVVLIEDDSASDEPIRLEVRAQLRDGTIHLDFTGTSAQRNNGLNCPPASTISMVHYGTKAVFAPDLPQNAGCNRPFRVHVPERSILAPRRPAAVSVRHLTQQAVADVVIKALAPLSPSTASAGAQIAFPTFVGGGNDDRPAILRRTNAEPPYYVISDIIGGGGGASAGADGMNAIDTHGGNCAILSAEVMETMAPFRVLRSELIPGSGGGGRTRGGLAIRRDYELLSSESMVSGYLQQTREETVPWGFDGGCSGKPGAAVLNPGTETERRLRSKFVGLRMRRGDVLRLDSAGGGGWGNPDDRDPEAATKDRELGYL